MKAKYSLENYFTVFFFFKVHAYNSIIPTCKVRKSKSRVNLHHNYYDFKLFQEFRSPCVFSLGWSKIDGTFTRPGSKDLNFSEPENDSGSKTIKKRKTNKKTLGVRKIALWFTVCLVPKEATRMSESLGL